MIPAAQDRVKGSGSLCRFPTQQLRGTTIVSSLILRSLLCSLLARSTWRSWNLPLYNLALCLCFSGSLCCWQRCRGLAMPAAPSARPSWSHQAPELCCLVRCSFALFLNSYVPCNVTSSAAVFPVYWYPRMMQNSNPQIVSLLPDFWYD